jgi:CheY-like chemotaxis protein
MMKILLVDDNRRARQMIINFLQGVTDEIYECDDGSDALPAYRKLLPDWVLMDWEMKRLNGLDATSQIIGEFPNAKIIMVTNYNENDLRQAAGDAGAIGFVLKENLITLNEYWKNQ